VPGLKKRERTKGWLQILLNRCIQQIGVIAPITALSSGCRRAAGIEGMDTGDNLQYRYWDIRLKQRRKKKESREKGKKKERMNE